MTADLPEPAGPQTTIGGPVSSRVSPFAIEETVGVSRKCCERSSPNRRCAALSADTRGCCQANVR